MIFKLLSRAVAPLCSPAPMFTLSIRNAVPLTLGAWGCLPLLFFSSTLDTLQGFFYAGFMLEADYAEFPFVEALPRREKSKVAKLWDLVQEIRAVSAESGPLIPSTLAAKCLGVSRQRVDDYLADGRLQEFRVDGHVFITGNSLVELAKTERKAGRPFKMPSTVGDAVRVAGELRKEAQK